jgi:hypothetical protein
MKYLRFFVTFTSFHNIRWRLELKIQAQWNVLQRYLNTAPPKLLTVSDLEEITSLNPIWMLNG